MSVSTTFDLLLRGGRVIDPASGIAGVVIVRGRQAFHQRQQHGREHDPPGRLGVQEVDEGADDEQRGGDRPAALAVALVGVDRAGFAERHRDVVDRRALDAKPITGRADPDPVC